MIGKTSVRTDMSRIATAPEAMRELSRSADRLSAALIAGGALLLLAALVISRAG
jgi:hypothetical protein